SAGWCRRVLRHPGTHAEYLAAGLSIRHRGDSGSGDELTPTSSIDISVQGLTHPVAYMCHAGVSMRDPEIIEAELVEISAIADDTLKFERIIAWCASHPDEVPFALHQLMRRHDKRHSPNS